jgi:D-beta-D-heptose 7-phosphate kinase/D-beta-D-heptose 1-phosphate adenosyltransferase
MLDRYVYGDVERISPEAPIPVLRANHGEITLGGVGNVVRNIISLGGKASLITLAGDDAASAQLHQHLTALGDSLLDTTIVKDATRPTSVKTRYVALRQQLLRYDEELTHPISQPFHDSILTKVRALLPSVQAIVLSDYGKGMLTPSLCQAIIAMATCPVFVDPKGSDYSKYSGATYITPNRQELQFATGMPTVSNSDIVAAATHLLSQYGFAGVFATRSEKGMSFVTTNAPPVHLPTEARDVFDVSGAGDTVIASLALAIAAKIDTPTAMQLANKAAGIVVGKKGTAVATPTDIMAAYANTLTDSKILNGEPLVRLVRLWQAQGLTIGFTNGCFDLLHVGHIATLRAAKQACDRLIVALNTDTSVKRLKGESRPLQSEADRCAIMASLSMVDAVTTFADDTPLALISALQPDVLVKGGDYTVDTVIGADVVHARGGRVLIVDTIEGKSTTNLAQRSKS